MALSRPFKEDRLVLQCPTRRKNMQGFELGTSILRGKTERKETKIRPVLSPNTFAVSSVTFSLYVRFIQTQTHPQNSPLLFFLSCSLSPSEVSIQRCVRCYGCFDYLGQTDEGKAERKGVRGRGRDGGQRDRERN